ncbi:MAG: hypothetical protein WAT93_02080 [Pontixanthobacter sp.]
MNDLPPGEALARKRFYTLSIIRLIGAISVMLGMMAAGGLSGWPIWIGYVLLIIGFGDFYIIPRMLAKRWRTPD